MSDFPPKPDASSPSLPTPPERRRGRVLLAATAASAAFTVAACGIGMTTNPAPCVYDGGLSESDCGPSSDTDAGTDAGVLQEP